MTNEEFQHLVLESLGNIERELSKVQAQEKESSAFISALTHQVGELGITTSKISISRIEDKLDKILDLTNCIILKNS
jgi:hypothetical protein